MEDNKSKFNSFLDDLKSFSCIERRKTLDIVKGIEKEKETTPIAQKVELKIEKTMKHFFIYRKPQEN